MQWTRGKAVLAAASGVVAVGVAATGFLLIPGSSHPPPPRPARTSTPPPSPTPAPTATVLRSPFTGLRVSRLGPVLAVKIDNIVLARPQTGLTKADIVYVIPVEGGLSRFMAIFSSQLPPVIGPVRSARQDDMELLRQFGRPAFAFSGAQPRLLPVVEHSHIVNLYAGVAGGYYRDYSRIAPYNLYANTRQLLREARGASIAHDIGFRFGRAPAGGQPRHSASASYSAASFAFTWSAAKRRWLVSIDGAPGATTEGPQLSAATVVIQRTTVGTSPYLEWGNIRPPYADSVGSGDALVLRDGKAWHARWRRPNFDSGTTYTTLSGQPMTFARGQVWVVLVQG